MCEWLQVIFWFYFLVHQHLYVWTIAGHVIFLFSGMPVFICANNCKSFHILILISGMQSIAHTNNCKSFKYFLACPHSYVRTIASYHWIYPIFWSANVCMCERLWVIFVSDFNFWRQSFAHTNDCKSFKKKTETILVCHRSYVQTIASHICFGF
jgi:hypothetical protein